jgi:hypothetical protein
VGLFRNLITVVNLLLRGSFQSLFCDHVESDLCGCCYFISHSHTQHSSSGGERVVSSDEDCTPQLSHRYCTCDALILRHTRRVTVHLLRYTSRSISMISRSQPKILNILKHIRWIETQFSLFSRLNFDDGRGVLASRCDLNSTTTS